MAGYNLIIKAETVEDAEYYVDDWLSVPATASSSLGYDEIMVSIVTTTDLTDDLNTWQNETKPSNGRPFGHGALIWWKV